ncbi:contact-dependent growth inhibition system immunity protein [Nocardia carnea]|uniref:contact-dependent growth inhibition system immunity protein n=1 Tax=Nocardia carnea TaxID=37328 RepID=UPI002456A982|nr:contact-dependent growth inhibition system immunity protein [Nocardia carnea]
MGGGANRGIDSRSVEEIEGHAWGAPSSEATYVVRRIHQLRQVPIGAFGIEDMRIMLSQNVGTAFILPRALDTLEEDPLSAGDFYPGDLLVAILRLSPEHWGDSALRGRVRRLAQQADASIGQREGGDYTQTRQLIDQFLAD